jgi:hypothetical protein
MPVTEVRPVVERIASELFDRLSLLAAGYSDYFIASEVIRPTRLDVGTPKNLQIVLTQGSPEVDEELGCPGNPPATAYRIVFNIRCRVMPSERDTTPVDEYINVMAAEVVRVVCDETELTYPWHTMENLAVNAEWQPHENIDSDGSYDGVNVPLLITYRVSENNPFEVRA